MTTRGSIRRGAVLLAGALGISGPAPAQTQRRHVLLSPPASDVAFTVTETSLQGPDTTAATLANVKLINRGHEIHQIQILAVLPPHTVPGALAELRNSGAPPQWLAAASGVGPVLAGQTGTLIQRLQPGQYLVFDNLRDRTQESYARRGLVRVLVVKGSGTRDQPRLAATAGLIVGDASLRFGTMLKRGDNYVLQEGRARMTELHAGEQVIQIETFGGRHSIVLLKAESPAAMHHYTQWLLGAASDPGGVLAGGLPSVQIGARVYLPVRLEHGTYFFFCPIRHARSGLPGFQTGEFAQFIVQ